MNPENTIEVNNITKSFKVYVDKSNTLEEKLFFTNRRKFQNREVLRGISFNVKKGEAVGLIGHNGCGKSTTLKLLTKIIYPDSGTIEMRGRVSSLIELAAGFHPDLSGRENIYINASIFGLSRRETDARLDDIIAFSELEEFIDNPVRTYSSGMYMRLAFSVAINVDADILLIDEILAVGDANFQAKCFNKLREIKAKGTTIVIVSHSLGQIEQICERTIWIHEGLIKEEGSPREVHPIYLDYMGHLRQEIAEKEAERQAEIAQNEQPSGQKTDSEKEKNEEETEAQPVIQPEENVIEAESEKNTNKKRWGNGKARITDYEMLDSNGKKQTVFPTGSDITIKIGYSINEPIKNAVIGIGIFRTDGINCYGTNTRIDKLDEYDLTQDGTVCVPLKKVMLMPGEYTLDLAIECDEGIPVDYYREVIRFEMYSTVGDVGIVKLDHEWKFE